MENNSYVYIYTRLDNNTIFYVGKGKDNRYLSLNDRNDHFLNIINKIPYKVEFLYENLTDNQALQLEKDTIYDLVFNQGYGIDIKNYIKPNEIKHLCNQTWGGEGVSGLVHTEETKKKISESRIGKYCGENNPMFGQHHTEEAIEKIRNAKTGRCLTEEHKQKISKSTNGRCLTEEHKQKMSENRMGENNPFYNKTHSNETKEKISKANSGKNNPNAKAVICITTNEIFDTVKEGAEYFGIKSSSKISACCKGDRKSCGKLADGTKLVWKYLVDYLNEQE